MLGINNKYLNKLSNQQKMKQKHLLLSVLILLILILIVVLGLIYTVYPKNQNILPDSFTINIYGDWSSSGGDRLFNSTLTFVNGKLTNGWQKYDYSGTTGIEKHYECIADVNTLTWRDKATLGDCGYKTSVTPLDLASLKQKISLEELKPADKCSRFDACYRIF